MPVFEATPVEGDPALAGVKVQTVTESNAAPLKRYEPGNPMADDKGYVYAPDIDPVAQMVDMISASRSYQANVEVFNTAKELAVATLNLGR
jgi:flagellar basal-body rod protein FlgC